MVQPSKSPRKGIGSTSDPNVMAQRVSKDTIIIETPFWSVIIVEGDSVMATPKLSDRELARVRGEQAGRQKHEVEGAGIQKGDE